MFEIKKSLDDGKREAWGELKSLLNARIKAAESGAISKKTMRQIALDKLKKLGAI